VIRHLAGRNKVLAIANSGLYAFRKDVFEELKDPDVPDHIAIPVSITGKKLLSVYEGLAQGKRKSYLNYRELIISESAAMAQNIRSVKLLKRLFKPFRFLAITQIKCNVLLSLSGVFFTLIFLLDLLLFNQHPFYAFFFLLQVFFYGAGMFRFSTLAYYFILMNIASIAALWDVTGGKHERQ
jgi:hypothetical protein